MLCLLVFSSTKSQASTDQEIQTKPRNRETSETCTTGIQKNPNYQRNKTMNALINACRRLFLPRHRIVSQTYSTAAEARKEVKTAMVEPEKAKKLNTKKAETGHEEIEVQEPMLEWDELYGGLSLVM
jgi:hypothetical protein